MNGKWSVQVVKMVSHRNTKEMPAATEKKPATVRGCYGADQMTLVAGGNNCSIPKRTVRILLRKRVTSYTKIKGKKKKSASNILLKSMQCSSYYSFTVMAFPEMIIFTCNYLL